MVTVGSERRWTRLDSEQRRAQILATAGRLFAERPYSAVSTTEIADAAGVTRGLLHHYFGTKRALYLEAVREIVDAPVESLTERAAAGPVGEIDWEHSVDAWMDLIEGNRDQWLAAIGVGETGRDPAMQELLEHTRERMARRILRVLGLTDLDSPEMRALVRGFGGFAEEVTREWIERKRLSREQVRYLLVRTLPLAIDELLPPVLARGEET